MGKSVITCVAIFDDPYTASDLEGFKEDFTDFCGEVDGSLVPDSVEVKYIDSDEYEAVQAINRDVAAKELTREAISQAVNDGKISFKVIVHDENDMAIAESSAYAFGEDDD